MTVTAPYVAAWQPKRAGQPPHRVLPSPAAPAPNLPRPPKPSPCCLQATVCAKAGLECIVYMGEKDMERQALNVFRMRLLGAEVGAGGGAGTRLGAEARQLSAAAGPCEGRRRATPPKLLACRQQVCAAAPRRPPPTPHPPPPTPHPPTHPPQVRPVTSGTRTLKDATSEAIRDWVTNVETTHYILGSVAGPHPFPMMVRCCSAAAAVPAAAAWRRPTPSPC